MSALALPAARAGPPRWPGSWAWADWPRCWPCRSNPCRPRARARRLRLPVPGLGLSHLGKPARRAARGSLLDVAGGRPGQHADGGAGRLPLATLLGVALAWRACRPSRWRRGWRPSSSRRCATPRCCCSSSSGTACCCAARRAPGLGAAAVGAAVQSRTGAAGVHGWLPQAASLIVAMLIAGWAIRRRRLATDGPAHRGHVLLIRVAPWLALAAQLLAWTLLPAPIVELPVRRGLACKAAGNPASNSPRWSSACRCSMPPISPTSCAPRCARCRRAGRGRTGAGAVAPGHPAPRGRAQCRARGAAALRQSVPGADQEQHAGHRHRLPGPDGRHQHRHHADRPGAGRHLAGAGGLSGPGPGAGGALSAWNARSARHGPGDLHGARLGERPALLAALAGRRRTLDAATGQDGRAGGAARRRFARRLGLAQRRLARRRGGLRASRRRLLGRRGREPAPVAVRRDAAGASRPRPGRLRRAAAGGRRRWARAGCPDGHAPASPSPRWRCRRRAVRLALGRRGHRPAALGRPAGHADPGDRGAAGRRAAGGRSGATAPLVQSRRLVRRRHADRGRARRAAGDATAVRVLRAAHAAGRRRVQVQHGAGRADAAHRLPAGRGAARRAASHPAGPDGGGPRAGHGLRPGLPGRDLAAGPAHRRAGGAGRVRGRGQDTSLVSIIGVFDVLGAAKAVVAGTAWRPYHVEVYLAVAALYFAASLALSRVARAMETGRL